MPKKNVREMSALERRRHSLSAGTIQSVLLLSVLLGLAAALFSVFLYGSSLRRECKESTYHLTGTAALAIDREMVRSLSEEVLGVYGGLSEEERADDGSAEYIAKFAHVKNEDFKALCDLIYIIQNQNEMVAGYVAAIDPETDRMIFIADCDPKETNCAPGTWDLLDHDVAEDLLYGDTGGFLDSFYDTEVLHASLSNMDQYGYRCTAGTKLCEVSDFHVFIFYDKDMNDVVKTETTFLWQYILLMAAVGILSGIFIVRNLRKNVVTPINQLANAAQAYVTSRHKGESPGSHFADLDIRTGNEIENLSLAMKDMETELADYIVNLTRVTAEKEKINTELDVAGKIQEGMIPHIYPAFPDRTEFDLYGAMSPAKEIGGDFYDYFLVDEDHLALLMADVSGEGIPAALFMMASKILLNNVARINKVSPAEMLAMVNDEICENNSAEMFVTVWLGILEISSGKLRAVNAGHEYPAFQKAGGGFEMYHDDPHGFVLGGCSGIRDREYEVQMEPGDGLFLYTDGVPEACRRGREQFGLDRMLAALNRMPDAEPEQILHTVMDQVALFTDEEAQFDDITMLCLRYRGGGMNNKEMDIEATVENLPAVTEFVNRNLENAACSPKILMQIELAVEEIFVNIASYAYVPDKGNAVVRVETCQDPPVVTITFIDEGVPYDPLVGKEPDITLPANEREIGGLGFFLVKQTMDDVEYEYKGGKNILRIRKKLS